MTGILLSLHVIAAILAIGPVAVAASMFPVASRAALADPDSASVATTGMLHRIVRVYATIGVVVPMLGVATAVISECSVTCGSSPRSHSPSLPP
jgi:hypothetical protein